MPNFRQLVLKIPPIQTPSYFPRSHVEAATALMKKPRHPCPHNHYQKAKRRGKLHTPQHIHAGRKETESILLGFQPMLVRNTDIPVGIHGALNSLD